MLFVTSDALTVCRSSDEELQGEFNLLRVRLERALERGAPWEAATELEVLTAADMPAWAALAGLIAACPVVHAGIVASLDRRLRSVDPHAFTFISEPRHIATVRAFVAALPEILWPTS